MVPRWHLAIAISSLVIENIVFSDDISRFKFTQKQGKFITSKRRKSEIHHLAIFDIRDFSLLYSFWLSEDSIY